MRLENITPRKKKKKEECGKDRGVGQKQRKRVEVRWESQWEEE
jgi:hypothetical protein